MFGAEIQGWINYYGRFYRSQMYLTLRHINSKLVWWAMRKFKKLKRHRRRAEHWLGRWRRTFRQCSHTGGWVCCRRLGNGSAVSREFMLRSARG